VPNTDEAEVPQASWGALFARGAEDPTSSRILDQPLVPDCLLEVYREAGMAHIETINFADDEGFFDADALFPDDAATNQIGEDEVFVTDAMRGWCAVLSRRMEHVPPGDHPLARALSHHTEVLALRAVKDDSLTGFLYRHGEATQITTFADMGFGFEWQDLVDFDGRKAPRGLRIELLGFNYGTLVCWEEVPEVLYVFRS
jgi:hypothetical protein